VSKPVQEVIPVSNSKKEKHDTRAQRKALRGLLKASPAARRVLETTNTSPKPNASGKILLYVDPCNAKKDRLPSFVSSDSN
jgi:hypothetical protein